MSRRGRPPILTETKKAEILAILATGCDRRRAAYYVGCDLKTIYNTALHDPEFQEKLYRVETTPQILHLVNVNNAGKEPRYWRASAWYLERTARDQFGTRSPDTLTPEEFQTILSEVCDIIVEEVPIARFQKQMLARLEQYIAETPQAIENRYRHGKYSYDKKPAFPKKTPIGSSPATEKLQISHVLQQGNNPVPPKNNENNGT
jgi:hypothetical protein